MNQLREKLAAALQSTQNVNRSLILFVFLFVVAVGAILVSLNSAKPYQTGESPGDSETGATSIVIQEPTVFVHVVGEVKNPGMFVVDSTARVFDAVFAAGGFTDEADQSSVNLAREVADGEQVVVLPAGSTASAKTNQIKTLVSINRASQLELETLPGVGPTLAGRMIDWRTANGGFKKKEDLLRVSGIGQKLFDSMKDKLSL